MLVTLCVIILEVIKTFANKQSAEIWKTGRTRGGAPAAIVRRKLAILDAATDLTDLRTPPGNRLEKLRGTREGQYSIRINDQYRICFRWRGHDAFDVELVDYHWKCLEDERNVSRKFNA
jgi:proteic killer suppression protein